MTVYAVYRTGKEANAFVAHPDVKTANSSGNGFHIVATQSDLNDKRHFPTSFLVDIYNKNSPGKIIKFRDRATAEKKVFELLSQHVEEHVVEEHVEEDSKAPTDKKPVPKKSRKIGRNFKYADCQFQAASKDNPRRKGTHGWRFYEFIISNPGITYENIPRVWGDEKFTHHLNHDVANGTIKAIKQ